MSNYAMLAVSVPDISEALPLDYTFPVTEWGVFVMLDDKFARLCETNMPERFKVSEFVSGKQLAEDGFLEAPGVSSGRPSLAFAATIASAVGINDPAYFDENFSLAANLRAEAILFPCTAVEFTMNGSVVKEKFMRIPIGSVLQSLVMGLAFQNRLSVVDSRDDGFSLNVRCLKTALSRLCEGHRTRAEREGHNVAYVFEYWMHYLIAAFLESRNCNVAHHVEVVSTYYGNPIDCGGMVEGVPYCSIGGLQQYDEDGWDDPRKSNPHEVKEITKILLGKKSKKKFDKYTPKFSG